MILGRRRAPRVVIVLELEATPVVSVESDEDGRLAQWLRERHPEIVTLVETEMLRVLLEELERRKASS